MAEEILLRLKEYVIKGDEEKAVELVKRALNEGMDPVRIMKEGLAEGVKALGESWEKGDIFLPDVMIGADVLKRASDILSPVIEKGRMKDYIKGKVVIGTCRGDIHDIGKDLVATLLKVNGFEVIDLGADVDPAKFVEARKNGEADMVALSCLLSTSVPFMYDVRDRLEAEGLREKTYLIVGGGTMNQDRAQDLRADGYGRHGENAVQLCNLLLSERPKAPLAEPIVREE